MPRLAASLDYNGPDLRMALIVAIRLAHFLSCMRNLSYAGRMVVGA